MVSFSWYIHVFITVAALLNFKDLSIFDYSPLLHWFRMSSPPLTIPLSLPLLNTLQGDCKLNYKRHPKRFRARPMTRMNCDLMAVAVGRKKIHRITVVGQFQEICLVTKVESLLGVLSCIKP